MLISLAFLCLIFQFSICWEQNPISLPIPLRQDLTTLYNSVQLSALAYCNIGPEYVFNFNDSSQKFLLHSTFEDTVTDMHGFTGVDDVNKKIYVVYRGTARKSISNYILDFQYVLVDGQYDNCPACQVHKGFKLGNDNTIDQVIEDVNELTRIYPTYSLIVTGHSLGAAVATLSSVKLQIAGFHPYLYTFGSPRVGNIFFSNYVEQLFPSPQTPIRVTHNRDLVPQLPFTFQGYVHISSEVYEDDVGVLHDCQYGPEDIHCNNRWLFIFSRFSDHETYLGQDMTICNPNPNK